MPTESDAIDQGIVAAATAGRWPRPRVSLGPGLIGVVVLTLIVLPCLLTLPWSIARYEARSDAGWLNPPTAAEPMGTDGLGRSMLWRSLLGGSISLGIGAASAALAVGIGVAWGALAGYAGGRVDAAMMRFVDILYGLPYILLVVLVKIALQPAVTTALVWCLGVGGEDSDDATASARAVANIVTLLVAIGGVSWLTMARVIRGQVLSLRAQPFIEAARALGLSPARILFKHILPNLVGPIIVYATLTVPSAILQESFLSFLGIGVQAPAPSWGNLAADGLREVHAIGRSAAGLSARPLLWLGVAGGVTLLGMFFLRGRWRWAITGVGAAVSVAAIVWLLVGILGEVRWWLLVWPCVLLGATLLSLNFLGDALRRKLDPRHARA